MTEKTLSVEVPDSFLSKLAEVKDVLLAIWCTDKSESDEIKCSLGNSISMVNEELERGRITCISKNRPRNPHVLDVTDSEKVRDVSHIEEETNDPVNVFKDILKVENLTSEQYHVFTRDQNSLLINGPAGGGKTVIVLAKIIQIIKSDEKNRAALVIYRRKHDIQSIERYQAILRHAEISNNLVPHDGDIATTLSKIVDSASGEKNNKVVIQELINHTESRKFLIDLVRETKLCVFVDDYQAVIGRYSKPATRDMLSIFREQLPADYLWVTCDLTQRYRYYSRFKSVYSAIIRDISPSSLVTLSLNLRNTCDMADILSKIREQIAKSGDEVEEEDINLVLPTIKPGHFIHGPRTVVHVVEEKVDRDNFNSSMITDIFCKELDRLCRTGGGCTFDIGVVHNMNKNLQSAISETVESEVSNNIELRHVNNCYSAEYPAVIVLLSVSYEGDISSLYLMLSRARVYCSVILYTLENETLSGCQPVADLLAEINHLVTIIRYD